MKKRVQKKSLICGLLIVSLLVSMLSFDNQSVFASDNLIVQDNVNLQIQGTEGLVDMGTTTSSVIRTMQLQPLEEEVELDSTEQAEKTTSAVLNLDHPFGELLVSVDEMTDFELFKSLFILHDLNGEQVKPYAYMNDQQFPSWSAYKQSIFKEKLANWAITANTDIGFRVEYSNYLMHLYYDQLNYGIIDENSKTIRELIKEILISIYDNFMESTVIDFEEDSYLDLDLEQIKLMDTIATYTGRSSEYYANLFLKKLREASRDLLSEDWDELHNKEYYKKVIYQLGIVEEKNIYPTIQMTQGPIAMESQEGEASPTERGIPENTDEATEQIARDMSAQGAGVSTKYALYANLKRDKLNGALLLSYQEIIDQKRGIVGWYYTGVHSEDYDHDTNNTDEGSRIFQENQLVALKLEERGSQFDIRRTLFGLYDEALDKETQSPSYFRGLKKVVYKAYISVPETEGYRFKVYLDNEVYRSGDYKAKFVLKDEEGQEVTTRNKNVWSSSLEKDTLYGVELQVYAQDTDAHLPDLIELKWSYGEVQDEVIANRYFFVDDNTQLTSKESIEIVHLDPIGDADKDGIPNAWEMDGFIVIGNTIRKYDEKLHKGQQVYYTSLVDKSTDGDPYTDLEEVINANISGVTDAGRHPLIAAYPEIVAELQSVSVNARMINKFTNQETESTMTLNTTGNTTVNKHTSKTDTVKGFSVGVHIDQSIGYAQTPVSAGVKLTGGSSVTAGGKYEKTDDSEDVTTTISNTQAATNADLLKIKALSQSTNSYKSGDLTFGIRLKNIGSASAYAITPNVSLYIGSEVGSNTPAFTTVEVPGDFYDLSPGQASQTLNIETRKIATNSNRQLALTVNEEVLDKIISGYPVSMRMNNASAKVIIDGTTRGDWDDYVNKINGITATINHQDAVNGLKKYKVFAASDVDKYRPQTTVGLALKNIYGDGFVIEDRTEDGVDNPRAYINGKYITNMSVYASDVALLNEYFQENNDAKVNLFNLPLRPSMILDVETSNTDETKPFILNTVYKRGKISAYVLGNCSEIKDVKAIMKVNGSTRNLTLKKSENNSLLYEYVFEEEVAIDPSWDNVIEATDKNNNKNRVELYIANAFFIKEQINKEAFGSRYTTLEQDYVVRNKQDALDFVNQHPGEAYVVTRKNGEIWSHSTTTTIYTKEEVVQFNKQWDSIEYDLTNYPELYIQGYFGKTGDKFRTVASQDYSIYLQNNQGRKKFSIGTGVNNATGYVVMMGSTSRANMENGTTFKLNNRTFKEAAWNENLIRSNMYFIKADSENPASIQGEISVPNADSRKKYNLQVVGYFTEEDGYNFKELEESISVQTVSSNMASVETRTISESQAFFEPKAYLLRVDGSNVGTAQNDVSVEINGVKMSHSRGNNRTGNFKVHMIVPKALNQRELKVKIINPNTGAESVANYNIDILGFFY